MVNNNHSRKGSLAFYPRVRAKKPIPSVNWDAHSKDTCNLLGFIGYKVGMVSAYVKDNTPDSLTKGKRIAVPATLIECPMMRIYSVRFYNNKRVVKDIVVTNDKLLKRKLKMPKNENGLSKIDFEYDDVRALLYSDVKSTGISKKKPDLIEVALSGTKEEKLEFIKERLSKPISVTEVFPDGLVDIHSVTKGYGTQGTLKRFGISLKDHKAEKGRRRPGSLSSFGLRRVTFRAPQAGQTGFHNRIAYNNQVLEAKKISEKDINPAQGFKKFGKIRTEYVLLKGSIPGPRKRGLAISVAQRPTKKTKKNSMEVLSLR